MQDLPSPPMTQEEVSRSTFRKTFEYSQSIEVNGLLDVVVLRLWTRNMYQQVGKLLDLDGCTRTRVVNMGKLLEFKSRVATKLFTQVQFVDDHETTSPMPASTPVKTKPTITNGKDLSVFHLGVSQAFVEAPLEEAIYMRLL